jgi:outer membrane protein TolC
MRKVSIFLLLMVSVLFGQDDAIVLDLSGWVQLAFENSPDLDRSSADLFSADAAVSSSKSFLWPSLTFGSSAGHSWSSTPDMTGGYTDTDNSSWSLSAGLSQEILASGGSSWLRLSGSRHAREASRYDLDQAGLDLTMDVIEAYYGVIESIGLLSTAEKALDRTNEQMRRIQSLYDLGAASNLELIQTEVKRSRDSLSLLQRRHAAVNAYGILHQTVGLIGSTASVNTAAVLQPISVRSATDIDIDLSRNFSLAASRERLIEAELSHKAYKRSYWPSLNANGSWNWNNDELEFDDFTDRDSWNVSLTLSWTLFDGFSRESRIQSSRASVLRQQASYELLDNSIRTAVLTRQNDLISSIEAWELSLELLNQAEEQLRLSMMSYNLGSLSLLDLLDAQSGVSEAEVFVESAIAFSLIAEARLFVLLGQIPRTGE